MKGKSLILATSLIVIGFIYRLIPGYPPNFTPIAAMALVGGLYINKKWLAFLIPVVALFLSDFILNNTINRVYFAEETGLIFWNSYMIWTYGAFLLTVGLGIIMKRSSAYTKILGGTLFSAILFFALSNFGSWLDPIMAYPKTLSGLGACFVAAIPFFRNTLFGNLVFVAMFVGSLELYLRYSSSGKLVKS